MHPICFQFFIPNLKYPKTVLCQLSNMDEWSQGSDSGQNEPIINKSEFCRLYFYYWMIDSLAKISHRAASRAS